MSSALTALAIEKHIILAKSLSEHATEMVAQSNWALLERWLIVPLSRNPEVVYAFVTMPDGEIVASIDDKLLEKTDPGVVSGQNDPSSILQERLLLMSAGYEALVVVSNLSLLTEAIHRETIRGKSGESVFDVRQKLTHYGNHVGFLRIGFS